MTGYRHILLAADFSPDNEPVVQKACSLARQFGARLSLIHVVEYTGTLYTGEIPMPEDLELDQRLAEQAEVRLRAIASDNGFIDAPQYVEIGVPKREIVRVAKEQEADLIVIGSHGRHGLQLLLGSTANGVLHLAGCDVLAVRVENA